MAGTLTGGLRDRMILESVHRAIQADLQAKGWLDEDRQHEPITLIDEYPDDDVEVRINTLAISYGDSYQVSLELGSKGETHTVAIYVDFYAESEALGRHVAGDVYAYLNEQVVFPVYDYSLATPVVDFSVELVEESVEKSRPTRAVNAWQRHWHTVSFMLRDDRSNG